MMAERYYSGTTVTDILQQEIDNADLLMRILSRLRYAEDELAHSLPITCTDDCISKEAAMDLMLLALEDDWEPDYATDRLNELPSAQPEPKLPKSDPSFTQDAISRQAAIEALGEGPKFKIKIFNSYEEGRSDQWFEDVAAITRLPSVQPEIITCKNCDHYGMRQGTPYCFEMYFDQDDPEFYCGYAERREDG